ncbi:MAG: cyclic nucleotide-binding domain-containing protein [Bacteroidota bacterium]|nr:cyclic nucleotide-binding domain-containing protein [Bacteroidota bacterium]
MDRYEGDFLNFSAGDVIVYEGDKSRGFYILMSGKVGVYKDNVKVTEFNEPGTVFGELGLILNKPRTATLFALEETKVLSIKTSLDDLIFRFPKITNNLIYNLADRLFKTTGDYVASVKLLDSELDMILKDGYEDV